MNSHALTLRSATATAPAPPASRRARPPVDRDGPAPAPRTRRVRPHHVALAVLLALTAFAYIWDLGASGDANSFYAAAVQAGTKSWKAFFFGSLDSSNFITVDKPPASLWVMDLSGRIFGFSSWSMLVPQALEGVAAVALLAAAVRRWFGPWSGILAGAVLALTPIAAVMFRFNNPDALLVLLLVAGAYGVVRALERGAMRWLLFAGAMIGLAFLAKMLQAFLVLPAFALVYMVAAPVSLRRRTVHTLAAGVAVVLSAGWWVAAVALWPVASRPMIDGSSDNSIFNLILGYNGLGRVFGGDGNAGGGGGGGGGFSGSTGLLRLFNDPMGGQASWLIPAALVALVVGILARGRAPRTDRTRAALLLWGGWLVVTGLVFSYSQGTIHTYYTVALAPAIAALVAIGGAQAWRHRDRLVFQVTVAATIALTAAWAVVLLRRAATFDAWLQPVIIAAAVLAILGIAAFAVVARLGGRRAIGRRASIAAAAFAAIAVMAGPSAYAVSGITTAHTGSTPAAGPSTGRGFGGGGFRGGFSRTADGRGTLPGGATVTGGPGGATRGGGSTGAGAPGGSAAGGGAPGGSAPTGRRGSSTGVPGARGGFSRGGGGPRGNVSVSAALKQALAADSGRYRWVAATSGSQSAASIELSTGGLPVMAIGGFSGQGGNLTLAQFQADVARGEIHYYLASSGGMGGRGGTSSSITSWVESRYAKVTVGGQTLYDLTSTR